MTLSAQEHSLAYNNNNTNTVSNSESDIIGLSFAPPGSRSYLRPPHRVYFTFSLDDNAIADYENEPDSRDNLCDIEMEAFFHFNCTAPTTSPQLPTPTADPAKNIIGEPTQIIDDNGDKCDKNNKLPAIDQTELSSCHHMCVRPKHGDSIVGLPNIIMKTPEMLNQGKMDEKDKIIKKRKKWKRVGAEEMGFRLTLFPRVPVVNNDEEDKREWEILSRLAREEVEKESVPQWAHQLLQLEGQGLMRTEKRLRRDQDRRVEKAHKQVKSKNLTSVLNNKGHKALYIHFRLYKRFGFLHCESHSHPNLPSPPKRPGVCLEVARAACKAQQRASLIGQTSSQVRAHRRGARPQNLAHALFNGNAANDIPTDIINFLISLQHREMTPEDYELLLRLDEGVAPKTVSNDVIGSFKTDIVDESTAGTGLCSVCMEAYEVGQKRKFLPCNHIFHEKCIDLWLSNSSQNCPLDGLAIAFS